MKDHSGTERGFYWNSRAYYADVNRFSTGEDEIMVGLYSSEGGTSGEMSVRWEELGGKVTPKLLAYDDSWSALSTFVDLLSDMADVDGKDISPEAFVGLLKRNGFKDLTPYASPYVDTKTRNLHAELVAIENRKVEIMRLIETNSESSEVEDGKTSS